MFHVKHFGECVLRQQAYIGSPESLWEMAHRSESIGICRCYGLMFHVKHPRRLSTEYAAARLVRCFTWNIRSLGDLVVRLDGQRHRREG